MGDIMHINVRIEGDLCMFMQCYIQKCFMGVTK